MLLYNIVHIVNPLLKSGAALLIVTGF